MGQGGLRWGQRHPPARLHLCPDPPWRSRAAGVVVTESVPKCLLPETAVTWRAQVGRVRHGRALRVNSHREASGNKTLSYVFKIHSGTFGPATSRRERVTGSLGPGLPRRGRGRPTSARLCPVGRPPGRGSEEWTCTRHVQEQRGRPWAGRGGGRASERGHLLQSPRRGCTSHRAPPGPGSRGAGEPGAPVVG